MTGISFTNKPQPAIVGLLCPDFKSESQIWQLSVSPFYGGGGILNEADHLLLHVYRLGLESKRHFIDQRFDTFAVSRAAK